MTNLSTQRPMARFTATFSAIFLLTAAPLSWRAMEAKQYQAFVTVSFQDQNGLYIENLTMDEVRVFEDGQPRKIEFFAGEEVPTVFGLLFDCSLIPEGLQDQRAEARRLSTAILVQDVAYALIDKYLGKNTLWVGAYGRELQIPLDFTPDGYRAKDIIQRLRGSRKPDDSFLYAALMSAARHMSGRTEKRRVVLVFMGLVDRETADKSKPLRNLLSSSNLEVFIVSSSSRIAEPGGMIPQLSDSTLNALGAVTAGDTLIMPAGSGHPEDAVRRILNQIRTFYTVGFESSSSVEKPAKLEISCTRPRSRAKHHPVTPVLE